MRALRENINQRGRGEHIARIRFEFLKRLKGGLTIEADTGNVAKALCSMSGKRVKTSLKIDND